MNFTKIILFVFSLGSLLFATDYWSVGWTWPKAFAGKVSRNNSENSVDNSDNLVAIKSTQFPFDTVVSNSNLNLLNTQAGFNTLYSSVFKSGDSTVKFNISRYGLSLELGIFPIVASSPANFNIEFKNIIERIPALINNGSGDTTTLFNGNTSCGAIPGCIYWVKTNYKGHVYKIYKQPENIMLYMTVDSIYPTLDTLKLHFDTVYTIGTNPNNAAVKDISNKQIYFSINGKRNSINVPSGEIENLSVYNIFGRCIAKFDKNDLAAMSLNTTSKTGLYLIKVNFKNSNAYRKILLY